MSLLVLNVNIEVVRVGEYGKGFVIVVSEVLKFVEELNCFVGRI